jgi:hypothetical protein
MTEYLKIFQTENFAIKYGIDLEKYKNIYFQLINEKIREVKTFLSDLRGRKVNKDFHDRIIVPREEVLLKLDNLLPLDQQQ